MRRAQRRSIGCSSIIQPVSFALLMWVHDAHRRLLRINLLHHSQLRPVCSVFSHPPHQWPLLNMVDLFPYFKLSYEPTDTIFHHSLLTIYVSAIFRIRKGSFPGTSEYGWGLIHPIGGTSNDSNKDPATTPQYIVCFSSSPKYIANGNMNRRKVARLRASDLMSWPRKKE